MIGALPAPSPGNAYPPTPGPVQTGMGLTGPGSSMARHATVAPGGCATCHNGATAPGKPALATPEANVAAEPPASLPPAQTFYKHGVTIRLQGSYAELTRYVERLEALPWTMQWESVRLDAHAHPQIELTLKLNTLSREPTWARL